MQKASRRIGSVGNRSAQKAAPKKVAAKKVAVKKTASSKRIAQNRVYRTKRTRMVRVAKSLLPQDNLAGAIDTIETVDAANHASSVTITEHSDIQQDSNILMSSDSPVSVVSDITPVVQGATMEIVQDTVSEEPSRSLMLCDGHNYMVQTVETADSQVSGTALKRLWKHAVTVMMNLPPVFLSLVGRRADYAPVSRERFVLQMLIINGSVRASNVEFRHPTSQEEAKSFSRSFTVLPPSDYYHPTLLQALRARLHSRGGQLVRRLRMQDAYGRLCIRGTQLFDRVRRELTIRSYLSRT
ncbi:MAG: hypothetical protein OEY86_07355 [Nitrospira sp.]|nr:hypothetical protein [Nitrospira sp.]